METILACVDNSVYTAPVAEYAAALASVAGAKAVGLYVIDVRLVEGSYAQLFYQVLPGEDTQAAEALTNLLESNGREGLRVAEAIFRRRGVEYELRVERGRPAQTIAALAPMYDLAVLGAHGADARFASRLLGSTVEELVRITTRPLLVVREQFRPISTVLIGYDGSSEATRAADLAISLAAKAGWRVVIAIAGPPVPEVDQLAAQARRFRGLDQVQHEIITEQGDPPHVLLELEERIGADLIAVGSRGVSKLRELLLGSTSQVLLREARCPVLIFR